MQNLIDKKNPLLVRFSMVKSLNFAVFLLESVSSLNISSFHNFIHFNNCTTQIWKIKNILFETVPGIFISKLTSAMEILGACVF